jgi:hypothetical protein
MKNHECALPSFVIHSAFILVFCMSSWRRRAIETFPELRSELEQPDTTIYQVFFKLLARVRDAHKRQDNGELERIYGFAAWCFDQKAKELWNAAAVAFYEHLVDEQRTRRQIPRWIRPDHFEELKPLFEDRLRPEQFRELCERYARQHQTRTRP